MDLGSGIRKKPIPDPGSGSTGQKGIYQALPVPDGFAEDSLACNHVNDRLVEAERKIVAVASSYQHQLSNQRPIGLNR